MDKEIIQRQGEKKYYFHINIEELKFFSFDFIWFEPIQLPQLNL